jgi:hypothetical protein
MNINEVLQATASSSNVIDNTPPKVPPKRPVRRKAEMIINNNKNNSYSQFTKLEELTLDNVIYLLTNQYNDKINESTVRSVKYNVKNGMSLSKCNDVDDIIGYVKIEKEDALLLLEIINYWKKNHILTSILPEMSHDHIPLLVPKKKTRSIISKADSEISKNISNKTKSPSLRLRTLKQPLNTSVTSLATISGDGIELNLKDNNDVKNEEDSKNGIISSFLCNSPSI